MSRFQRLWPLVAGAVLVWLLAILPAYYVVHRPITGPQLAALLSVLLDLCLAAATLIVAAAWGSRLARWLGLDFPSELERWSIAALLGLGLLGTLVFALAAAGGLYRWVGYVVLAALALSALPEIGRLARRLLAGLRAPGTGRISWLWLYTAAIGLFTLVLALLPPTAWDALVYHLQGPRLYVEAHRLVAVPESFYLNWPAQVEMLFTWGLLLKGDTLAQVLNWAFWPLTAALLYALARQASDARGGRWAAALWASVPVAGALASWPYVDLALAAFIVAAFYSLLRWTETESGRWLAVSALFAGLALASKYTAATWLAAIALLVVYHAWRHQRRRPGRAVVSAVVYGLVALLVAVPWLAKNWIVTGNPIYPFLFGGAAWNAARAQWTTLSAVSYSGNPLDYVALPWLMTVLGIDGTGAFDATIGPLLLCLAPLFVLFRGRPRSVNYALAVAGSQWAYFLLATARYAFMAQTRLIFPVLPLLCLVAAYVLQRLPTWDRPSFRLSWVVNIVAGLVLAFSLISEGYAFLGVRPFPVLAGLESRQEYLSRRLGAYYETMRYAGERLPANARLMLLYEPRAYYSRPYALGDATLDHVAQLRLTYGTPDQAAAGLRQVGYSHLVFYRTGLDLLSAPTPRAPTLGSLVGRPPEEISFYPIQVEDRDFLDGLLAECRLVYQVGDSYEVYELPE